MAYNSLRKLRANRFRQLAVESLQSRLVFTSALHAFLDMGELGYGQTVVDVGIGATGDIRVLGGGSYANGKVWDFDGTGNLIKQQEVGVVAGGRAAIPQALSPNGNWLAGAQQDSDYLFSEFSLWGGSDLSTFDPLVGIKAVRDAANTGDLLVIGQDYKTWYRWNSSQGLIALAPLEGASEPHANAISADGSVIIGWSDIGNKMVPTLWDASGPHALTANGKSMAASSVSEDGRVIGGYTLNSAQNTAVVWTNGTLKQLVDVNGAPAKGVVDTVVNGLWGDSDRWVAFGNDENNKPWIAFDDGVARPLQQWLYDHHNITLNEPSKNLGQLELYKVMAAKAEGNNLEIVLAELEYAGETTSIPPHLFFGPTRPHLLVVPLDESAMPLEVHPIDVNDDGVVSPMDAWLIINQLQAGHAGSLAERPELAINWPNIDTSGDGELSALDALNVISLINRIAEQNLAMASETANAEGEANNLISPSPSVVDIDSVFGELELRSRRLRR